MICCVEDDAGIRELELYALRSSGYEAEGFEDGESFEEFLAHARPELVLLDVMLPGRSGVDLLKRMKGSADTMDVPVIMATARGAEYEKVSSLDLGADDYLVKPFGMLEMVSRVKAVLRRCRPAEDGDAKELSSGGLVLSPLRHEVTADGAPVELTAMEFKLLRLLMEHPGTVYTRDMLFGIVWGRDWYGETRTVDAHVGSLRRKLGSCGELIETVRGVGYRLGAAK